MVWMFKRMVNLRSSRAQPKAILGLKCWFGNRAPPGPPDPEGGGPRVSLDYAAGWTPPKRGRGGEMGNNHTGRKHWLLI